MSIVIAPSAFKGTLTAGQAADALAGAFSSLSDGIIRCPLADGGDGTLDVLVAALDGDLIPVTVTDPLGHEIHAEIGMLPTGVAVVEMARSSGMAVLGDIGSNVMTRTSRGLGQMISAALDQRPRRIIVGLGGSASCDGGLGALQALGIGFFDDQGQAIQDASRLIDLARIDETFRDSRLDEVEILLACDVVNPLLGITGAARVFGPQKGADPEQIVQLEAGLKRLAEVLMVTRGRWVGESPGAAAAGGTAAGLNALTGAEIRPGFQLISHLIAFGRVLEGASLLVVGEGSIDHQSGLGKASLAAAALARARRLPVWAFGGRIELDLATLETFGIEAASDLSEGEVDSLAEPAEALALAAARLISSRGLSGSGQTLDI